MVTKFKYINIFKIIILSRVNYQIKKKLYSTCKIDFDTYNINKKIYK